MKLQLIPKQTYDIANEAQKIAEEITKGNWIPFAMITVLLGVVVILLMHIYNTRLNGIDDRHDDHEARLKAMLDKHDIMIEALHANAFRQDRIIAVHEEQLSNIKHKK